MKPAAATPKPKPRTYVVRHEFAPAGPESDEVIRRMIRVLLRRPREGK